MERSLLWLRDDMPHRRLAACAVLHQLAEYAPTIFFQHSLEFFSSIWGPLRDNKNEIRFAAARSLSACLAVLKNRKHHLQSYCNIYEQIVIGLRKKTKEETHGSLIVIVEMLRHTDSFMLPRFREICQAILHLKDHRSRTVRSAIISLLPELAAFCPETFARVFLTESLDMLILNTDNRDLKKQSLLAIGRLALAIGYRPSLERRVPEIASVVTRYFDS